MAKETEIKDFAAHDLELLLSRHYKLETVTAGTQCAL